MLDIKYIREHAEEIRQNIKNRGVKVDLDEFLKLDEQWRENKQDLEKLFALRNQKSKTKPSEEEIIKMRAVGDRIKESEKTGGELEVKYKELLLQIPNLTHPQSPVGGENDFKVVFESKVKPPRFKFTPLDHETLMLKNDLIDFERGAKVAGSKFYFYKNTMVRLNQALINYGLDIVTKHGYQLLETPDLCKSGVLEASGFNPRGAETQTYKIEGQDLNLIGTAEITVLGYHAGEVLDLSGGPLKYAALSHCFRTEAGAYGKAVKGLYRVHQFTKLEMFIFCRPEDSEKLHQELLNIEKEICDGLELPYRVIDIPTGDLGGPAYRKYDLEAWMTMKNDYGEITSTSNCADYQARDANIKHKKDSLPGEAGAKTGGTELVHTLNGTAIVLSRFPLAIVENYQQPDGSIAVPKVLRKYCGLKKL